MEVPVVFVIPLCEGICQKRRWLVAEALILTSVAEAAAGAEYPVIEIQYPFGDLVIMPPRGSIPLKAMLVVAVLVDLVKFWPDDAFATSRNVKLLLIPDGVNAVEVVVLPIRTKVTFPGM